MSDTYRTIESLSLGEYKEKGSKFIAYAEMIEETGGVKSFLQRVKKEHPKARHHCFAWRLGLDKRKDYRANDDGEPSGSAGRPILGQIDSVGLTNIMVIVVRYFGGTKLGVPGLIRAYKTSTRDALDQATIVDKIVQNFYQLSFDYTKMNEVMRVVKQEKLSIQQQYYEEKCKLELSIRQRDSERIMGQFGKIKELESKVLFTK